MKKTYKKPMVEIEVYSLDTSIASNCSMVVSNGPEVEHHQMCADYVDPMERALPHNVSFYNDVTFPCDCYYTSSEPGYWTS